MLHALTSLLLFIAPAHAESSPNDEFNFHLQATTVTQSHGEFPSAYTGAKSLKASAEQETSLTWTLFAGARLWRDAEVYLDPELTGGSGLSGTQGLAGFPNGEIFRVDDPSPKWTLARLYVRQVFGLGGGETKVEDDKNQLAGTLDQRHVTVVAGRFALNDFLDNLSYSHDPRTQFLNWALMDYGAWDYAADTRGYAWGGLVEYRDLSWALRFASVMEVESANAMSLDFNYPHARGDNLEFEWDFAQGERPGAFRALLFENHASMGNYRDALVVASTSPDVTATRGSNVKYGVGLSVEQALTDILSVFARLSWNDGATETWTFTEIDRSVSAGLVARGNAWHREKDAAGFALIANGLSDAHRDYLAAGGVGFIIGDGQLNYAPEEIAEIYYLAHLFPGFDFTGDYQFFENPAYNRDRGPVSVFAIRLHYEI